MIVYASVHVWIHIINQIITYCNLLGGTGATAVSDCCCCWWLWTRVVNHAAGKWIYASSGTFRGQGRQQQQKETETEMRARRDQRTSFDADGFAFATVPIILHPGQNFLFLIDTNYLCSGHGMVIFINLKSVPLSVRLVFSLLFSVKCCRAYSRHSARNWVSFLKVRT